jgi:ribose-phosphate pyrophosphokinase
MKNVVLLADPNTPAWGFAKKIQNYLVDKKSDYLKLYELDMTKFRNKEFLPYSPKNIRKKHVYYIQSSKKHPNDWWAELLLSKDMALSASVESLTFVLPNMPYSRQDRKHKSRVPISARAVARSISPGVKRIITMDLHAPQIQGFYPDEMPLDNLYSFPEAVKYIREHHYGDLENLLVVSPDTGGVKRVKSFLKRLSIANKKDTKNHNYSTANILKIRDENNKIEEMKIIGNVKGKNVIVVDDMYDTCGTILDAGKLLKENGAKKLMSYATHGLLTKRKKELTDFFDVVMTSNTHYDKKNSTIEVIDMSPLFAQAIYRAQKGKSISSLFD